MKTLISRYLCDNLKRVAINFNQQQLSSIEEIRLRVNNPLIFKMGEKEHVHNYVVTKEDIQKTVELMSNYSLYAFEEQLKNGYITLEGGHRVGITGKTVLENNTVKTIKNISFLNIRISHQIVGCSDKIIKYLYDTKFRHTLLISPPRCGKTTLLRDIIRSLSNDYKMNVAVVDERSEIAGCCMGIPQNDVGMRTDILDGCPKAEGMLMLLRSMSPDVIAVDEIGKNEDIQAICEIINAGIKLICTIHGECLDEIRNKPVFKQFLDKKIIERIIVLGAQNGAGTVVDIYDENYKKLR